MAPRKAKIVNENNENSFERQTKINEFFTLRRSCRTNSKDLKNKEKEDLERCIKEVEREKDSSHLIVKEIEEKGRGIVAGRQFFKGEFLVEYAGELIEIKTAKERESNYNRSSAGSYMYYFKYKSKNYCIDATAETGRLGRLVNHSRLKPNCSTKVVEVENVPRLILVANKTIKKHEELLYDYGDRSKESILAHPWLAL